MADEFCLKMPDFHVTFRDLSHAVNLRHGTNGVTSLPKEGVLRIFFSPWKVRRLQPGLNPRTWLPNASTLPLDHRSRYILECICDKNCGIRRLFSVIIIALFIPLILPKESDEERGRWLTFCEWSLILPSPCEWDLRSFGVLRNVHW